MFRNPYFLYGFLDLEEARKSISISGTPAFSKGIMCFKRAHVVLSTPQIRCSNFPGSLGLDLAISVHAHTFTWASMFPFHMILYGFHMIFYGFYMIWYYFHKIIYGFLYD